MTENNKEKKNEVKISNNTSNKYNYTTNHDYLSINQKIIIKKIIF